MPVARLAARAEPARRHGRPRHRRRGHAAAAAREPRHLRRSGQGGRGSRAGDDEPRRRGDLRRSADARPATQSRARTRLQGDRSQRADPRHLRAARAQPRGQAPGRAGAAAVPPAAPHPAVDPSLAPAWRRGGHAGPRRDAARGRPAPGTRAHRSSPPPGSVDCTRHLHRTERRAADAHRGRRLHQRRQVDVDERAHPRRRARRSAARTLDPTVRRLRLPEGLTIVLADTVGFIHKLPHQLVEAFMGTLEQVRTADLVPTSSTPLIPCGASTCVTEEVLARSVPASAGGHGRTRRTW